MFRGYWAEVNSVAFSPDSRFLVSGGDDSMVRIWNMRDGSSREFSGYTHRLVISVTFSSNGKYVAAGDASGFLRVWNARTNKLVEEWQGHTDQVWGLMFTSDGKGLVSGSIDRTLMLVCLGSTRRSRGGKSLVEPKD
jgi:glucose repression regulatory protein TUP1